jgi:hypothetical protein
MITEKQTSSARQQGQALVAVIVLIALLFLIGTAMTLAVSSSLQTVRQTADEDWRGYAAESAVTRDLASASDVSPPAQPPVCSGPSSLGASVNGFAMSAKRCAVLQVTGATTTRNAIASQKVGGGSCAQPAVTVDTGRKAWGTIAWLRPGFDPNLRVFLDGENTCRPPGASPTDCTISVSVSVGVAYFSCPDNDTSMRMLHVMVQNPRGARLSAFYIRSADEAPTVCGDECGGATVDCVVTSIGIATRPGDPSGAIDEGDLLKPSCGTANTSVAFWNKLLP